MATPHDRKAERLKGMALWAITSYFNPLRYSSRLRIFRIFRRFLRIPLVAVELGYDNQFDSTGDDAEMLVRVSGTDVLWQKERLLNLALANVPPHVKCIAWMDCDVILERDDWPEAVLDALRDCELVQLFSELNDLPRMVVPPLRVELNEITGRSIAHLLSTGSYTVADLAPTSSMRPRQMAWGLAWAARKPLLARHGFYDALVVGSGDRALACAAYGRYDNPVTIARMNASQQAHYLQWAEPFYCDVQGNVGCVEGCLYHLWHGDIANRRYRERHELFSSYAFDPATDIVINGSGAYKWADHRRDLAEFCRSYFMSRLEDGSP